jgi:hypothetical protein
MSFASLVHNAVAAVCPIDGVSIGVKTDKTTWRVDYKPEATTAQRTAAAQAVASFNIDAALNPPPIDYSSSDNLERSLKAVLLCVAQVGGLSVNQIRTMFKNKYDQLG